MPTKDALVQINVKIPRSLREAMLDRGLTSAWVRALITKQLTREALASESELLLPPSRQMES